MYGIKGLIRSRSLEKTPRKSLSHQGADSATRTWMLTGLWADVVLARAVWHNYLLFCLKPFRIMFTAIFILKWGMEWSPQSHHTTANPPAIQTEGYHRSKAKLHPSLHRGLPKSCFPSHEQGINAAPLRWYLNSCQHTAQ